MRRGYLLCVLFVIVTCNGSGAVVFSDFMNAFHIKLSKGVTEDSDLCKHHRAHMPPQMIDASSKLPSGIFVGNHVDLGNYDECVTIRHELPDEGTMIRGQYCNVRFTIDSTDLEEFGGGLNEDDIVLFRTASRKNAFVRDEDESIEEPEEPEEPKEVIFKLGLALCTPDSCPADEIHQILQMQLDASGIRIPIHGLNVSCMTNEPKAFSVSEKFALVVFSAFGLVMVVSTVYDLFLRYFELPVDYPLYVSFSIFTNAARLLAVHPSSSGDNISCIHGLRALSMMWVILGHRLFMMLDSPMINKKNFFDWTHRYHSTLITGATVSGDTFFALSGLLLAYHFMKRMDQTKTLQLFPFYRHRYLRLTPALAAMVFLSATFLPRLADGPLWQESLEFTQKPCEDFWWSAMLYVQNYVNPTEHCIDQSWYLSVDMQLFVISPIILIPLWKWPRRSIQVIIVVLIASVAILVGITYGNGYHVGFTNDDADGEMYTDVYIPTHARYGPWLAGILTGYFLHITREEAIFIDKRLLAAIWLAIATAMLAIVMGVYPFYLMDSSTPSLAENVIYLSLSRISWGICICWIIFACKHGYGGPANWILSWGIWQPISRLSYCLYITHLILQLMLTKSRRVPESFSDIELFYQFFGDLCFGLLISTFWSLAFESPILAMEKYFSNYKRPARQKPTAHVPEAGHDNNSYPMDDDF